MRSREAFAQIAVMSAFIGCAAPAAPARATATAAGQDAGVAQRDLLATAQAIFAAIQRRDRVALESLTTPDFILRVPGAPDMDRAGFLAAIASIPGEILAVEGEQVAAHVQADGTGVVTGFQVARVRVDGNVLVDRGAFADLFVRRDGRWRMNFAFSVVVPVEMPAKPASPDRRR
jgi:ketosteroid isomerase-like protein